MPKPVLVGLLDLLQTATSDVGATVAFYREVLGADVQSEGTHWARLRLGNVDIGVHYAPPDPPGEVARNEANAVTAGWLPGFRVPSVAAVRAAVLAAGLECRDYHDIPGGVTLQFRDPTGNWLAAIEYGVSVAELGSREA